MLAASCNPKFSVNKSTVVLSYVTYFFQYGTGLLVLPVILQNLDADSVALWYTFLSIFSLVSLLDFGFSPSIQRSVTYVFSGSDELLEEGYSVNAGNEVNANLLSSLIYTGKYIYKILSIVILLLMSTLGLVYFNNCAQGDVINIDFIITWFLYSLSTAIYFYYNWILSFVRGRGQIKEYNYIIVIGKLLFLVILILLVMLDYGLLSLVIANFINTIAQIVMGRLFFFDKKVKLILSRSHSKPKNLYNIIKKNAVNSGIVSIGVFLLSQAGVFLSNFFLPLYEVAQLGVTLQVFGVLVVLSRVYLTTNVPRISSLWIINNKQSISNIFYKSQLIGYIIFFTGVVGVICCGNFLLEKVVHSNVLLPTNYVILLYALFYFMELTHGNCCTVISTSNYIPFTTASIISGSTSVVCTIVFAKLGLGIISFPLALCCGSLPYNSWKWPVVLYKMLK